MFSEAPHLCRRVVLVQWVKIYQKPTHVTTRSNCLPRLHATQATNQADEGKHLRAGPHRATAMPRDAHRSRFPPKWILLFEIQINNQQAAYRQHRDFRKHTYSANPPSRHDSKGQLLLACPPRVLRVKDQLPTAVPARYFSLLFPTEGSIWLLRPNPTSHHLAPYTS